jgi:hypothetical protein
VAKETLVPLLGVLPALSFLVLLYRRGPVLPETLIELLGVTILCVGWILISLLHYGLGLALAGLGAFFTIGALCYQLWSARKRLS